MMIHYTTLWYHYGTEEAYVRKETATALAMNDTRNYLKNE